MSWAVSAYSPRAVFVCGPAQEQLVYCEGDDLILGHAMDANRPVVDDARHPGEGGAQLGVGQGRLGTHQGTVEHMT